MRNARIDAISTLSWTQIKVVIEIHRWFDCCVYDAVFTEQRTVTSLPRDTQTKLNFQDGLDWNFLLSQVSKISNDHELQHFPTIQVNKLILEGCNPVLTWQSFFTSSSFYLVISISFLLLLFDFTNVRMFTNESSLICSTIISSLTLNPLHISLIFATSYHFSSFILFIYRWSKSEAKVKPHR